jgi:hypothetical protein
MSLTWGWDLAALELEQALYNKKSVIKLCNVL